MIKSLRAHHMTEPTLVPTVRCPFCSAETELTFQSIIVSCENDYYEGDPRDFYYSGFGHAVVWTCRTCNKGLSIGNDFVRLTEEDLDEPDEREDG